MCEPLDDQQIDQLLAVAEARLEHKASDLVQSESALTPLDAGARGTKARKAIAKLRHGLDRGGYLKDEQGIATLDTNLVVSHGPEDSTHGGHLTQVPRPRPRGAVNDQPTSGPQWFDMPKTELTPQLKRDLQVIEMRSVLDPHRHYKKNNRQGMVPAFSQTGTVVEGPTEFYSARINKKNRGQNFVDDALAVERATGRFVRKYAEIQNSKTSGRKAYYDKLMKKRRKRP